MRTSIFAGLLLACTAACLSAQEESAPLAPDAALKSFEAAEGITIEFVAAEPLVESPCAMAFDERGRLYVAENRGYPNTESPAQGRISLLEDTDGDGRMDHRTTFAEALSYPNGVLPWKGGLLVTCAPDLLYFKDTDGDGKADERRVVLTGFDSTKSTQLRVNAPTLGPDGWIYLAAGLAGGTISSPEQPGVSIKMTADLRWNPRSGAIENVDGKSQYGMSFDDFGRRFICMNRLPVQHVVLPSLKLARNPHLAFSDTVQDCSDRSVQSGLRGGGAGVRLFPISHNITTADSHAGSFSAACGIFIWRGGALPSQYGGCAFSCDPTGNLIHVDRLNPQGATFSANPLLAGREFLASRDDWFRPVYITSGPDGALYVCDMYRKTIEHPDYLPEEVRKRTDFESGKNMGRIWRMRSTGNNPHRPTKIFTDGSPDQVALALARANGWRTQTAFRLLAQDSPETVTPAVRSALSQGADTQGHVALLELLALNGDLHREDLDPLLASTDEGMREFALQQFDEHHDWIAETPAPLRDFATDPSGRVRLNLSFVLGSEHGTEAVRALARIVAGSASDKWIEAAVLSSSAGRTRDLLNAIGQITPPIERDLFSFYRAAGRLIGASGEASEPDQVLTAVAGSARGAYALMAGFAEAKSLRLRDEGAVGALLRSAVQEIERPPTRAKELNGAFALLARAAWEFAKPPLTQALSSPNPVVAEMALGTLADFDSPEVTRTLLSADLWQHYTPVEREAMLGKLWARKSNFPGLLDALASGNLPVSAISATRRDAFLKNKDEAIRKRTAELFGSQTASTEQAQARARGALALKPDPKHGRDVFRALCSTCHRLDREGHAVGPDLLDIRNQSKESILFHIVAPDAEIAPAFTAYQAETKEGRTLIGILASETPTSVTLRMPLGQEEVLLRSALTSLTALQGSLMPSSLQSATDTQGLADLLAYLKGEL